MKKKPTAKKILSWIVDGLLVALIGVLGYVQISMMTTKDKNHGVPMAFGSSFLYVVTDSMTVYEYDEGGNIKTEDGKKVVDESQGIPMGSGIIIQQIDPAKLNPSKPIYEYDEDGVVKVDEEGRPIVLDYDDTGDVVTFYDEVDLKLPDTHRVIKIEENDGAYTIFTMGDRRDIHKNFRLFDPEQRRTLENVPYRYVQTFRQDALIGKVVTHSMWFGTLLTMISPDAAQSASLVTGENKTAWLLPVAILVPLVGLALMSILDVFKTAKAEERETEAKLQEAMAKAGIDPNDEEAVELFRQKEELKIEYRAKMEEELYRAREEARKKAAKEKERKKKE